MTRLVKAAALAALAACSGAPGRSAEPPPVTAAIHRDGDPRHRFETRTMRRPDGELAAVPSASPRPASAMVVVRKVVELEAGKSWLELPEVPTAAEPGSIWLRARKGPGALEVSRIHRPSSLAEPAGLRGRIVTARSDGSEITGTLIDIGPGGGALLARRGVLVVLPPQVLELSDPGDGDAAVRAEVVAGRAGRYPLEIAYRTGGLSWSLDVHLDVAPAAFGLGPAEVDLTPVIAVVNRAAPLPGARVELVEGRGDSERQAAQSIWSGPLDLPLGETRRPLPGRSVKGAIELRYRGSFGDRDAGRTRPGWGTASLPTVERVLRLPAGALPPAAALAHVTVKKRGPPGRYEVPLARPDNPEAPVDIVLGAARDLSGTRRQLWVKAAPDGSVIAESYELAVLNRSDRAAAVRISEPLARSEDVELIEKPEAARLVAGALEIVVPVGPRSRQAIRYVARYRMHR